MYHASSIKDESIATTSDTNDQPEHCLTTLQTDPPALTLFHDEKFMKANPVYPRERKPKSPMQIHDHDDESNRGSCHQFY